MKKTNSLETWKKGIQSVQNRLALASVVSFATALAVLTIFWFQYVEREKARAENNFISLAKTLTLASEEAILTTNIPLISSYVTQIEKINKNIACTTVFDRDGRVIFRHAKSEQRTTDLCQDIQKDFNKHLPDQDKNGWTEKISGGKYLNVVEPIMIEDHSWGWVAVVFSLEESTREELRMYSGLGLMFLWFTLVFSATLYYVRQTIVQPLSALSRATEEIARGNLAYRVEYHSRDEIGQLTYSFNEMVREVKKSRDRLEEFTETLEQKVEERTEELRKAEAQLVQSTKLAAIGQLAGGVAHEINNPLGGILGFTQLLIRERKADDPVLDDLKRIEESAIRCKKIVENLLSFSRMSKGFRQLVEVNEALQETLALVEHQLRLAEIELSTDFVSDKLNVLADRHQLQQVFLNMLLNAKDAMSEGGDLTITTSLDEKKVFIRFSDTGSGISKTNLSRIFDPFFTTKEVGRGTGLGLSVSYGIVKEHGGDIRVESEVGKGTTFEIILPRSKEDRKTKTARDRITLADQGEGP